ncbi:hypothetical protein T492DRAFT_374403 [Pavlovales sp. CCMP2436]|nr:hypothetical protein T492DRAFT_374403 [Pavlovales sp. CCMP2436]
MNTTVQLKLKRLQALRADESGVIASLEHLSEFHEPSLVPHEDRRMLRGAIEQRSVAINEEFLQQFDGLSEKLRAVESDVATVSSNLGEALSRLNAVKSSSRVLIEHVLGARQSMRDNEGRRVAITSFLELFELSESDKAVLSSQPRPASATGASADEIDVDSVLAVMKKLGAFFFLLLLLLHYHSVPTISFSFFTSFFTFTFTSLSLRPHYLVLFFYFFFYFYFYFTITPSPLSRSPA